MTNIQVPSITWQTCGMTLVGDTPLISHRFGETAMEDMLRSQQGLPKLKRVRDPEKEFREALYVIPDTDPEQYGFPLNGFKMSAVRGALRAE